MQNNFKNPEDFLTEKGIKHVIVNDQYRMKCMFNSCDENHKVKDGHLYMNRSTGAYFCQKCEEKGNLATLCKKMEWPMADAFVKTVVQKQNLNDKAKYFQTTLTDEAKKYLNSRGLTDKTIALFKLGFSEKRNAIAIPHIQNGDVVNIHYRGLSERGYIFEAGRDLVLYNTDAFSENVKECFLFEGEFDMMLAHQWGIKNVLSVPNGAKPPTKWKSYFDKFEKVYICFDNDEAGQKATKETIALLGWEKCWNVLLPKESGKDLTDYYLKGASFEDFQKLVDGASREEVISGFEKNVISYQKFIEKEYPPVKWVVDKIIPMGISILSASPGNFKTFLLLALAKQISNGESVFNQFNVKKLNVLFVNEEMGPRTFQDRLKIIQGEAQNLYFTNLAGIKLKDMDDILKFCKEKDIQLVIFDSLTRIHDYQENDSSQVKKIFESLLKLFREDISVILSHHHRKASLFGNNKSSDEMRGSTDILAQIDCHLTVDIIAKDKSYLVIKQQKIRQAETIKDFRLDIEKDKNSKIAFTYKGEFKIQDIQQLKADSGRDTVLEIIKDNGGLTKNKIIEKLKGVLGIGTIKIILKNLEEEEYIYSMTKKPKTYYLKDENEILF